MSQNTPENTGAYTLRPSIRTSSLLAEVLLKPRAEIAQVLASDCATSKPGTIRNASAMLVTPERRMSSLVMTAIAAAASESFSGFFDTEVTSISNNSSRLRFFSSVGDWMLSLVCADVRGPAKTNAATPANETMRRTQTRIHSLDDNAI